MHKAVRHLVSCRALLQAVCLAPTTAAEAAAVAAACNTRHSSSRQPQPHQSLAQSVSSTLLPWHARHAAQQQQQQEQEQPPETPQQAASSSNDQPQQQQRQQPPSTSGADKQEPQQQQGPQQPHKQDDPLEGPNGLLAEWRIESSGWWSNMYRLVVDSSLNYPQFVTWSELYQPKPPGFLRRLLVPEGCSNLTLPLNHMYRRHSLISEFLLSQAHADWDADAFKQGVKQAVEYTMLLYGASDWIELKPIVSTALLQSMQHARQQQAAQMEASEVTVGGWEMRIDLDSVRLMSATAITREQLGTIDSQRASAALPLIPVGCDDEESATVDSAAAAAAAAASSAAASPVAEGAADLAVWDVAHVYAEGVLSTTVTQAGSGPQQVELRKRGHWLLCRGPIHIDRVLTAEAAEKAPWLLLSWL